MNLISFTDKGLYCEAGNFYIDPWKPVDKAIITHAHSDHAYSGHKNYLCHSHTKPLLQLRLGDNHYQSVEWNESVMMNGVKISLHPAGHIIGSSQIRIEYNSEVWVVSGDYKTEDDGISGAFEPVRCNTFITESTFGLPIYNWKPQKEIFESIKTWINRNKETGKTSVLIAYSLGKAQRVLQHIKETTQTIFVHGAIWNTHQVLLSMPDFRDKLPDVVRITPDTPKDALKETVVIAPPSADGTPWMKKFSPYSVGVCSGWMQVRGNVRRRNVDAGFALSDHSDWNGLLQSIKATGAERVFVTHGFQHAFSRYLNEEGIAIAAEVKTEYGNEDEEAPPILPEREEQENADF
ncbi:MAG: ligase-associated DNA damage response exonuclease [Chitinophagaceae bacterium]|nr:ligase-associated DNA damage response exonuclease [Chitinophagaceae bacterium]